MIRSRSKELRSAIREIIKDAGGRLVGRTRLQKTAYLLELTGHGCNAKFSYKHYGPYSDELATAANEAVILGTIDEAEVASSWGGLYSIFTIPDRTGHEVDPARKKIIEVCRDANAIELELAATAAYLAEHGESDAWALVRQLKPSKATNARLEAAKTLYRRLTEIKTDKPLPKITASAPKPRRKKAGR